MLARFTRRCLLLIGIAVLTGCGGGFDSAVHGVVTLDGKVVPRGTVTFHPVSGGPVAYAMISDDGSYAVRTGREKGLPAGEYQVTVTANAAHERSAIRKRRSSATGKSHHARIVSNDGNFGAEVHRATGQERDQLGAEMDDPGGMEAGD